VERTQFAGLLVLEPGESINEGSGAFIGTDRKTIDHFLQIGAKTHRHTGLNGLTNPAAAPGASIIASGGTISADLAISLGYTLEDENSGETMLSPVAVVSTQPPLSSPVAAPSAVANYAGGSLLVNTYYYALTWGDGEGGETPLGASVNVERAPGFASGRVQLSNLNYGMVAAGAKEWRLYRATGGGSYYLLTTGGTGASTFTDDGSHSLDCSTTPPAGEENTTVGINTLLVTLPSGVQAGTTFINLYASVTSDFSGGSLIGRYPVASAGHVAAFSSLSFGETSPPPVNLSIGGAHQIDPDTELLEWHWKRPVTASGLLGSGTMGDVKLSEQDGLLFAVLSASAANPSQWVRIASGGGGGAITASGTGGTINPAEKLTFVGSGGLLVNLAEGAKKEAIITITAGAPRLTMIASGVSVPELEVEEVTASGGVNVQHTNPGPHQSKLKFEGDRQFLGQEGMGVIIHGSNAAVARGTKFRQYTWIGTVKPTNIQVHDIWIESS
jgi:hypothetical protein